jgi:phage FluMu gp28-like protein
MRQASPVVRWEMPADFAGRPETIRKGVTDDWCRDNLDPVIALLDPNLMTCFGEDFGRLGDLTVIWPLQIERGMNRRTPFVVELRNIPFRQQEQVLFYIADRLPRFFAGAMDARGNGQYLAETAMQRYGQRIRQVMLTVEWYRENMPRFRAAFEDGNIEIPRDADILADHRMLVIEKGVVHVGERRERDTSGRPRHGDSAMAAALAYFASHQDVVEYGYTGARRAASSGGPSSSMAMMPDLAEDRPPGERARPFGAGAW